MVVEALSANERLKEEEKNGILLLHAVW